MKTTTYRHFDKTLIAEGAKLPFKLYRYDDGNGTYYPVLFPNKSISELEAKQWQTVNLYVTPDEEAAYENYAVLHMTPHMTQDFKTFIARSKLMLQKSEQMMQAIFSHPESSDNLVKVNAIVNDLIVTVLNEEFNVTSLIELTQEDYDIHTHSINVSIYALSLGKYLNLQENDLHQLGIAALIHDLGKSKIRADVINKQGRLTSYEFEYVKRHPKLSHEIAQKMGITDEKILYAIKHHKENIDGTGYPDHIKAGQISLFARMLSICDTFDAMTSNRSYKDSVSTFDTLKMMKTKMNHQLDERLLNSFIMMMHV